MPGFLQEFVDRNRIGCPPLAADDPLLLHMMRGMALSTRMSDFTTMLLEFLILTTVSDMLCVSVAVSGK